MTEPAVTDPNVFGPGVLKIGATGSEIDASCMVNNLQITASPNRGDSKTMLCGTQKAGSVTYDYEMGGNLDLDLESGADSLFALSQEYPGSTQAFTFTPNTEGETTATGELILDPLAFGSTDGFGAIMNSDIAFVVVGQPTYTYAGAAAPPAATGATAGSPGAFTPAGAVVPANLAALQSASPAVVASPNTAWTTGQSVNLGTGSAHWDGSAYVAGLAV